MQNYGVLIKKDVYKDGFTTLLCSNVIYKCLWSGFNATYYEKISRNLKVRCNEHYGIGKSGSKHASPNPSYIWEYIKQTGHKAS